MRIDTALLREALRGPMPLPPLGSRIDTSRAKPAAVVVPIMLDPEPRAIFVLRGAELRDHGGEVAFPGGKPDPGDVDLAATALRELSEEVGVAPHEIELCGELRAMPVITGRYLIYPFVGVLAKSAAPRAATREVARVIEVALAPLLSGAQPIAAIRVEWGGAEIFAPHFALDDCVLYGATAYIFYELLARLAATLGTAMPEAVVQGEAPWGDRYSR